LISFGDIEGYQNKHVGLLISPNTEDKFLYGTLVLVNAYKCTKFQLHSCISFKDTMGVPKYKKMGATDLFKRPLADIFLYRALTHSLTAALDQLRVVTSSTSNDPGPRSRQHQQIGQCLLPIAAANFFVDDPAGASKSAAGGVPVWASIDSCSVCEAGVFSGRRQI